MVHWEVFVMENEILYVEGMHCKSCEMIVKDVLEEIGVESKVSHENGTVEVTFDDEKVSLDEIKKAIKGEGYEVS